MEAYMLLGAPSNAPLYAYIYSSSPRPNAEEGSWCSSGHNLAAALRGHIRRRTLEFGRTKGFQDWSGSHHLPSTQSPGFEEVPSVLITLPSCCSSSASAQEGIQLGVSSGVDCGFPCWWLEPRAMMDQTQRAADGRASSVRPPYNHCHPHSHPLPILQSYNLTISQSYNLTIGLIHSMRVPLQPCLICPTSIQSLSSTFSSFANLTIL